MKATRLLLAGWLLACLTTGSADAQTVRLFDNRADFQAATGDTLALLDFEGPEGLFETLEFPGVVFSSVDGTVHDLLIVGPSSYSPLTSNVLVSNRNFNPLIAEFPDGVNAIGTEVFSLIAGTELTLTLTGPHGESALALAVETDTATFFGVFVEDGYLTRLEIAPEWNAFAAVDDFAYGWGAPPVLTLEQVLTELTAAVEEGLADGTIDQRGSAITTHMQQVERASASGNPRQVDAALRALANYVRARTGKGIAPERAEELLAWIEAALDNLDGE